MTAIDRYEQARTIVIAEHKASASFVSRMLGIGYNEASGYMERLEKDGVIGAPDHVGRREILIAAPEPRS